MPTPWTPRDRALQVPLRPTVRYVTASTVTSPNMPVLDSA